VRGDPTKAQVEKPRGFAKVNRGRITQKYVKPHSVEIEEKKARNNLIMRLTDRSINN
jgi:hypothetical protein